MNALLSTIREAPLKCLPEASLSQLYLFRQAYGARYRMHGHQYSWGQKMNRFGPWIRKRFQMAPSAIELAEPVILYFSDDDKDAFYKYFELLQEFNSLDIEKLEPSPEVRAKVRNSLSPLEAFAQQLQSDPEHLWSHSDLLHAAIGSPENRPIRPKSLSEIMRPDPTKKLPTNHLEIGYVSWLLRICRR